MDEPRPCSSTLSDLENRECGMVESESFMDSTRRMVVIGSRLARGCVAVGCVRVGLGNG